MLSIINKEVRETKDETLTENKTRVIMMTMKLVVVIILVLLGIYWLLFHTQPFPMNHEQFGLYQHNIHRIVGVVFLLAAGVVWWKWKPKKESK